MSERLFDLLGAVGLEFVSVQDLVQLVKMHQFMRVVRHCEQVMRFKAGEVDSARILVDAFNSVLALASSDLLENVDAFVEAQEGEVILDLLKVAGHFTL